MFATKIESLNDLLEVLPECSGKDYVDLVHDLHLYPEEFTGYSFWNKDFYTRNCIARSTKYELILLCWEPGQETPIHDHGGEECWVYMLQGHLGETRYRLSDNNEAATVVQQSELEEGQFSYMNDNMGLHSLKNLSNGRSMSLHLYMNPINECHILDADTNTISTRQMHYHSIEGIPSVSGLV